MSSFVWTEQDLYGVADLDYTMCCVDSDGSFYAGGVYTDQIGHSVDSGSSWNLTTPDMSGGFTHIHCSDDGQYVVVCESPGLLYLSSDYGDTWTELTPLGAGTSAAWVACVCDGDASFIAAAQLNSGYNQTYHWWMSFDGGSSWTDNRVGPVFPNNRPRAITDAACTSNGVYQIISGSSNLADDGCVWISSDSGANWSHIHPTGWVYGYFASVDVSSDGSVMVAASNGPGSVHMSTNYGVTWTEIFPSGVDENLWWGGSQVSDDGQVLCFCEFGFVSPQVNGKIWFSDNQGFSWEDITPPTSHFGDFQNLAMDSTGNHIITGELAGELFTGIRGTSIKSVSGVAWYSWYFIEDINDDDMIIDIKKVAGVTK